MGKAKPTSVNVVRIELSTTERKMVEQWMMPQVIQGYAKTGAVLGLVAAGGVVAYTAYQLSKSVADWLGSPLEFIGDVASEAWGFAKFLGGASLAEAKGGEGGTIGGRWGVPFWRFIPESATWEHYEFNKETRTWSWIPEAESEWQKQHG